jgi:hypothetical protein
VKPRLAWNSQSSQVARLPYVYSRSNRRKIEAEHLWLMSVVVATQEGEIKGIRTPSQLWQIVLKTLYRKYPIQENLEPYHPLQA